MQALEDGMDVTRQQTAAQLDRLGASVSTIVSALIDVYNAGFDSVIDVLLNLGYAFDAIIDTVCDFFGC